MALIILSNVLVLTLNLNKLKEMKGYPANCAILTFAVLNLLFSLNIFQILMR